MESILFAVEILFTIVCYKYYDEIILGNKKQEMIFKVRTPDAVQEAFLLWHL